MPALSALLLDCVTEADRPSGSRPADAALRSLAQWYTRVDAANEIVRVAEQAAGDDGWRVLMAKIMQADIIVIGAPDTPAGSANAAKPLIDRLVGGDDEAPLLGKVAGVLITGDGGGADEVAATLLLSLSRLGAVIPPSTGTRHSVQSLAQNTVDLAHQLGSRDPEDDDDETAADPLPRKLFGNLPTGSLGIDPAVIEAEKRAALEGRLVERRRTVDLTRRDKGLPEQRALPRPTLDADSADPPS